MEIRLQERPVKVQDMLRKFEKGATNNVTRPVPAARGQRPVNHYSKPNVSPRPVLPTGLSAPDVAGSRQQSSGLNICTWSVRRRRAIMQHPSGKSSSPPVRPNRTQNRNSKNLSNNEQVSVSQLARLFQQQASEPEQRNREPEKPLPAVANDNRNDGDSVPTKNGNALQKSETYNDGEELYADTLTRPAAGQAKMDNGRRQLPSGPPPQKPTRTFAHDIYMNNKLVRQLSEGGAPPTDAEDQKRVIRTRSNTVANKPKLPPKPARSKTVPAIGQRVKFLNRLNNEKSGPRDVLPCPPPAEPPVAPSTSTATSRWYCPRPWNVSDAAPAVATLPSSRIMAAAAAVLVSPVVSAGALNRMKNYAQLKRSRSEERIYDVPAATGCNFGLRHHARPDLGCACPTLDRRKSPSVGSTADGAGIYLSDDVLFVDNELYVRDGGLYATPQPLAVMCAADVVSQVQAGVGIDGNGFQGLHYMSSPIVTENRSFPERSLSGCHHSVRGNASNNSRNDTGRCSAGSNTVNMVEWRIHDETKETRHKSLAYFPPCGVNQECDVVNWSFASVYDTPLRTSSLREDDSGSDSEVSEKEVLKRIAYIHKISRGPSMRKDSQPPMPSYRKQFDAVLIVGLKYVEDGDTCYHPYVKEIFPFPGAVECSVDEIAHFCFPDAACWKPAAQRETYTFTLTNEKGERLFGYCRRVKPDGVEYNIPIVYCIISPVLARAYYSQVLGELEKRHGLPDLKMRAFLQMLQARSVPQPGKSICIKCPELEGEDQIIISRKYNFPLDNADTARLLTQLSIPVLIKVFASLLLERRVLFMASKPEVLTECIHALVSLLHPFTWQHTFIPLLPSKMLDIISAPTPYVVGILSSSEPLIRDLQMEDTIFVDLESSQILRQLGDETTIIPKKIQSALTTALKFIKHRPDDPESPNSALINEAFLRMFVELVGHYELHISCYPEGSRIFHCNSFNTAPASHSVQMFLKWFTETQMFDIFIEKKTLPPENNSVDLFDQYIRDKVAEADKPSLKNNVREFRKKMLNFGEKLIRIKTPVKA